MNMGDNTTQNQPQGFGHLRETHQTIDMQAARLSGLIRALFTTASEHSALSTNCRENTGVMALIDVIEESTDRLREQLEAAWAEIVAMEKEA